MLEGLFLLENSMKHKHIIKSLPLLASVLGRKYGVQVRIGGNDAYTDGNVIQLPSLPLDCDDTLLGLIRGYVDHEAAHIRDTDFDALKAANLTPLEKHIWNTIEDWRVENVLAGVYPGCRENFQWLIRHFFLPKSTKRKRKEQGADPAMLILEWLLITVRSWDVAELDEKRDYLRASAEIHYPGLTHELEPVLRLVPKNCSSTLEAFGFACEITDIIRKYAHFMEQQQSQQQDPSGQGASGIGANSSAQTDGRIDPAQALHSLQNMLAAGAGKDFGDIGDKLKKALSDACALPFLPASRPSPLSRTNWMIPVGRPRLCAPGCKQCCKVPASSEITAVLQELSTSASCIRSPQAIPKCFCAGENWPV